MTAYYNEIDKKTSQWIRELIKAGLIAHGEVDDRSIVDVQPSDLKGFTQCHFFAGIAGWSLALRMAGVPDDYPVWTASLPCQPFSVAGKQNGKNDERHLLPHYIELVKHCHPKLQFGEQVSGAIRHDWLDDLYTEMEKCDYSCWSAIIGAHSVGAPHQRQRLYWVANANEIGCNSGSKNTGQEERIGARIDSRCADNYGIPNPVIERLQRHRESGIKSVSQRWEGEEGRSSESSVIGGMGNTEHHGRFTSEKSRSHDTSIFKSKERTYATCELEGTGSPRAISEWIDPEWLYCLDNKYRPIKSSIKPLVARLSKGMVPSGNIDYDNTQFARVMRIKGYGNSIVPQLAAEFIGAFFDVTNA